MPKRETPVTDVIQLAQKLVRFQSFGGQIEPVFDYLHAALSGHGFNVRLLDCTEAGPSPVLYAAAGEGKGGLLFAGHLDVASPGTEADWKNGAFAGEIKNGSLCARGICEMKGAVAAFVGACEQLLSAGELRGRVGILLSGDEESSVPRGLECGAKYLLQKGESYDCCLYGSPTNPKKLGEEIKIGSRGEIVFEITSFGASGHPGSHSAQGNSLHNLLDLLCKIKADALDTGNEKFGPSTVQVISVETENREDGVIPSRASAKVNICFNTNHRMEDVVSWVQKNVIFSSGQFELKYDLRHPGYYNYPERELKLLQQAVEHSTGMLPHCGTAGAASSASALVQLCPVIEFGLVNALMHRVNKSAKVEDIYLLEIIYKDFIRACLNSNGQN